MQNAKPITIWLLIIASLSGLSYGTIYAYKYVTTTTIEDVSSKVEAYEKAKSDLQKVRINYCNDTSTGKVDYDKCGETLEKLIPWTHSTGSTVPPSQVIYLYSDKEVEMMDKLSNLHKDVCKKQINSPLCKDRELFDRLYQLTEDRLPWKNFYPILLWITNAESSLWLNFAKDKIGWTCAGRNNWWGIKWKKTDDGKSVRDQQIPDQFWCYLYQFDSIEDYWISKVNTIRYGYPWCIDSPTPIKCLSYAYVGDRNVAESSWIRNVSIFLN